MSIQITDDNGRALGHAARVLEFAGTGPDGFTCRGCGGTAAGNGTHPPPGWYSLTCAVPAWLSHRGYVWIGIYCSVACLAASVPRLTEMERLAHQAYEPVLPDDRAGAR